MNCTGLGARDLLDVKDNTVIPVRGQVLSVNAPWVRSGWTRQTGSLAGGEGGERTYIIPRVSGEVIIGGTREQNDWHGQPRNDTSADIIRRALEICPQLAAGTKSGMAQKIVDLRALVKAEIVGFRPTRENGICLEKAPPASHAIPIIHNYGHGGGLNTPILRVSAKSL